MTKSFLIDGYNLLHALGIFPRQVKPQALERARVRMLELIADAHKDRNEPVTVVFDARNAPRKLKAVQHFRGIEVLYAVKHDEADDLIEEQIRQHATPRQLTVVSDDHRLQQAGRRRRCQVLKCAEYLDQACDRRPPAPPAAAQDDEEKQARLTESEIRHWMEEFRDLAQDQAWNEMNPFDLNDW
jgi:predicted RNA-binding protein with PIN domain